MEEGERSFNRIGTPAFFLHGDRMRARIDGELLRRADLAWLVTTVYTCGCYRVVLPTELFPRGALPRDWPPVVKSSRNHRVKDLETLPDPPADTLVHLEVRSMDELHRLPVEGVSGCSDSFFYAD